MAFSSSWLRSAALVSAVVVGAAILYRFDPTTAGFFPPCMFRKLTGLLCPGCGTTRALHHLLHGDVGAAFALNPMLFAVAPFTAAATTSRRFATHPVTGWAAAVVTMVWWVARNVYA